MRRGDRPAIVVLVSADAEWTPVKQHLSPEHLDTSPYGEYFRQTIAGSDVLFLHGGWGKIAAAASTEYAIGRWRPEAVINLGTCGGLEGRVERGEQLLVTRAITYDIEETMGDAAEAIRFYTIDIDLSWLTTPLPIEVRRALIMSADRDLKPLQVQELIDRYDAIAADWESSAIAFVASRRRVPVMIIRSVSDIVGPNGGDVIGALDYFRTVAANSMRRLLADLTTLVPYVITQVRAHRPPEESSDSVIRPAAP